MYNRFQHQAPTHSRHDPPTQSSPERGTTKDDILSSMGLYSGVLIDKGEGTAADGQKGNNRGEARLTDLCALGGALLFETGVEGVALTDTGKVVACGARDVRSRLASGRNMIFHLPYHQR